MNDGEGSVDGGGDSIGGESVQEERDIVGAVKQIGLHTGNETIPEERVIIDYNQVNNKSK